MMSDVKTRNLIPADLNEGQKEAYIQMRSFIESHDNRMYLLEGYAGTGKAQPLHSKILTPNGWTTMGEIKPGDSVISGDGNPTNVMGVFPQGIREIFKVEFSDGSSTECCGEHLWTVKNYINRNYRNKKGDKVDRPWSIMPLDALHDLKYLDRLNYNIPLVGMIEYNNIEDLLVDPYLMGLLLGDECISQHHAVNFSSIDAELVEAVDELAPDGCTFSKYSTSSSGHVEGRIVFKGGIKNPLLESNRFLGIQGLDSKNKFIPDVYLRSKSINRIALLQGLLDTDGNCSKTNLTYSTSSKKLRDNVIELVRSLGGIATWSSKLPRYTYKDRNLTGSIAFTVFINLPADIKPFRLKRKVQAYKYHTKYTPVRYITNIATVGKMECQCIMVDHPDHLYVTDDFIVTHNTYLVGKLLRYVKEVHTNWLIAVTAPTNKAVKVLMRSGNINDNKVKFQTIHKLLGLKEEITADGKQIFTRNQYEKCSIDEHNLIIVDEVSMLNDDLFKEIEQYSGSVKIIFMGDPAQIPPVGREDCIPFKEDERKKFKIDRFLLTEIMRQTEGNPILKAGWSLREDLNNPSSPVPRQTDLNEDGHGLDFIDFGESAERNRLSQLFEKYFVCNEFKDDADHAKVIAWRNKTINKLNHIIRSLIYKDCELTKIMDGEKLVASKPIMDKYKIMLFTTNDEFEVSKFEVLSKTYATDTDSVRLKYYHATVEFLDMRGAKQSRKIDILHEDSSVDFDRVLASMKKAAIEQKGFEAKKLWVTYYGFMRQFADVSYNYAITCHKCVSEDSMVLTSKGWMCIKEVQIGDLIWSQDSFRPITNKWTSEKDGIKFTTKSGRTLICSDEHLVKQYDLNETFVEASKLIVGNKLMTPIMSKEHINLEHDELMWLYGVIIGNGSFSANQKQDGRIEISFNRDETTLIEEVLAVATKYVGHIPTVRDKSLYWNSCSFHAKFLQNGFKYVDNIKCMPTNIKHGIHSLLRGLMDADGSVGQPGIRFVNISEQVVTTMQMYFLQYGIISSIKLSHKTGTYFQNGKEYNKQDAYTLTISIPASIRKYRKYIGFTDPSKLNKLDTHISAQRRVKTNDIPDDVKHLLEHRYFFDEIIDIQPISIVPMVDIEVEDLYEFNCNGFAVHNCQGSTYKNVFIIEDDINTNPNVFERNRIRYTAYTRASNIVFVVKS